MNKRLVRRVRILEYIGDEAWVRTCTESPNNYVTYSVDFKDKDGNVLKKISSRLLDIVDATPEELV